MKLENWRLAIRNEVEGGIQNVFRGLISEMNYASKIYHRLYSIIHQVKHIYQLFDPKQITVSDDMEKCNVSRLK